MRCEFCDNNAHGHNYAYGGWTPLCIDCTKTVPTEAWKPIIKEKVSITEKKLMEVSNESQKNRKT